MGTGLLVLGIPVAALSNIGGRDFLRGRTFNAGTVGITASRLGVAFDLAAAIQLGHSICIDLSAGSTPIEEGMSSRLDERAYRAGYCGIGS